ncbi:MAG: PPOX class F420-dependent oxidoreductase [Chloroflexi bacterium]|nr:MAG: PPOX class F420-dependent oxidoreductase [Chloroflexota bacterium]TMC72924.1 MAG: PPOX class F420-dependent oxidoreductase [Chloroflexota bacterium]
MPVLELPPAVDHFLKLPNPAVIACVRPDGFPMSVATWYDWQDGRILVNMHESRSRLRWMRANPKVSLTVLGEDWYRHVSLFGLVVSIADDTTLADIDRLSRRYTGRPFSKRTAKRVSAWIEPHGWHGWDDEGEISSRPVR